MEVIISKSITNILPSFDVIALSMNASVKETDKKILNLIDDYEKKISGEYSLEDVLNIPLIKEARDSYKKLGKDPSRYRLACESLLRRIVKGNKLYIINNLVDLGNILSIDCFRSVAVLDYDKIVGDVYIRVGTKDDLYEGINRGIIDVSNIPLYVDSISPFGSTTSDTLRTSITINTKKILIFIICFGNNDKIKNQEKAIQLYRDYANATNIEFIKVRME